MLLNLSFLLCRLNQGFRGVEGQEQSSPKPSGTSSTLQLPYFLVGGPGWDLGCYRLPHTLRSALCLAGVGNAKGLSTELGLPVETGKKSNLQNDWEDVLWKNASTLGFKSWLSLVSQVPVGRQPLFSNAAFLGLWIGCNNSSLRRLPGGLNEMQAWTQGVGTKPSATA